ncbi:hypothetical protein GLYMA_19G175150v4 [Glycine max]|nr:hypothetical protein GLYMA_19G175150v4 [Glycine max]KAH1078338.1 hypothetical protein GYH30_053373 [Glycine max]
MKERKKVTFVASIHKKAKFEMLTEENNIVNFNGDNIEFDQIGNGTDFASCILASTNIEHNLQ